MDTIFALASAPGKSGVAVVRIAGPDAAMAYSVFGVEQPKNGRGLRRLRCGDELIDEAFCLHFDEGRSFTGDETVELHLHGSTAVLDRVFKELSKAGFRHAEPGEFTRRAFETGRLDLSQVEGLADLIDAETEVQRKQAVRVLSGAIGEKAEAWKTDLQAVAVMFAASFDFSDEDVPETVLSGAQDLVKRVLDDINTVLDQSRSTERVRTGFEVTILGAPNVGKSTLLNRLAGREAAITSKIAGTTRDVIEVRMDIGGYPVTLVDTAGLRETEDEIESIGIARARDRAELSDLRIVLAEDGKSTEYESDARTIIVKAKADQGGGVSGVTGQGVDELIEQIMHRLSQLSPDAGLLIRQRHRDCLIDAVENLTHAHGLLEIGGDEVIISDLVLLAMRRLDALIGKVDVEVILGDIFSSFCIGK